MGEGEWKMLTELTSTNYELLLPLLPAVPRDPLLYMVLEGNRPGRIFVDQPVHPTLAMIWTGMEYAYLIGDATPASAAVIPVVEETILPALADCGLDFVTIFPFGTAPATIQAWFPFRQPVSFGVNAFAFDHNEFTRLTTEVSPLPPDYKVVRLDEDTLVQPASYQVREDILFCWDTPQRFATMGIGYVVQHLANEVVCACYAIGYGAQAYHINVWTHPAYRRKGLARHAVIAFLHECLAQDRTIYWINDAPNLASRRLAESVGFVYTGDLPTVDIPVQPYQFHIGLAQHFANYLHLYEPAGKLYDIAFSLQPGDVQTYKQAAITWQQAGNFGRSIQYQRKIAKLQG
jgi:RimJ/RimL family protein N-acetyltransferase